MRTFLSAVGAALLLVSVAGCIGSGVVKTPVPTPSATPVFASDEEALAAAEAAYAAYQEVSGQIFAEGGIDPERLSSVAAGDQLETELSGFEDVARLGQHSTGKASFRDLALQQYSRAPGPDMVVVYLCEDITEVDVLDAAGKSLVSSSRPDLTTYEVSFDLASGGSTLLVSRKSVWEVGC